MILCLDVGNTQIYGGFFDGKKFTNSFRLNSKNNQASDEIGVFLTSFCSQSGIDTTKINDISISSVVPSIDYSLNSACIKYFNITPFFIKSGIKTGLEIKLKNSQEVGADLIACAIAATKNFPNKNMLIADLGTASTIIAISKKSEFLGGVIMPGLKIQVESLAKSAEKLYSVEIKNKPQILGRSTVEAIQSGIYYSHLFALQKIIEGISLEVFPGEELVVIGTGGLSKVFKGEKIFDVFDDNLILWGLMHALEMNK